MYSSEKKERKISLNFSVCVYFRNFRRLYFNDFSSDLVVLYFSSLRTYRSNTRTLFYFSLCYRLFVAYFLRLCFFGELSVSVCQSDNFCGANG